MKGKIVLSVLCLLLASVALEAQPGLVIDPGMAFQVYTVITLVTGTMFLMWLGEQVTKHGIGNGVSLIITVNIVARMPSAVATLYEMAITGGGITDTRFRAVHLLILFIIFNAFVIAFNLNV